MGYFDAIRLPFMSGFRLHRCWQCDGTGIVLAEIDFFDGGGVADVEVRCDLCEGQGRITAEQMSWRDNPPNDDVGWA